MSNRAVRMGMVLAGVAVFAVGATVVGGDDSHVYNTMKIQLHGDVVTVEITQSWVTSVADLKDKTVEIALFLTSHDDKVRAVEVFSSAPDSPNAKASVSVGHVKRFQAGGLSREELVKKVTITPLPPRPGQNRRWSA